MIIMANEKLLINVNDVYSLFDKSGFARLHVADIDTIPRVNVEPVRHGQWIEYQIPPIICCSNCDWATDVKEKNFNYCPNCGAKMDLED